VSSSSGRAASPRSSPGGVPGGDLILGAIQQPSAGRLRWLRRSRGGRDGWSRGGRNRYATTALVTGVLGAALVTILVSLVCGVLGLLRARRAGPGGAGKVRCWLGIGFALGWAVVAGYLAPNLARAADPGCVAYKGSALVAYGRVIDDFTAGAEDAGTARDLAAAIRQLDEAAAASRNEAALDSLTAMSAQLQTVLSDVRAGRPVPQAVLRALNRDSALADGACGTVRL
jgi:hypothetical protein